MEYHRSYKNGYDDFHTNTQDYFESTLLFIIINFIDVCKMCKVLNHMIWNVNELYFYYF